MSNLYQSQESYISVTAESHSLIFHNEQLENCHGNKELHNQDATEPNTTLLFESVAEVLVTESSLNVVCLVQLTNTSRLLDE
jgi:hypothetical protein